MKQIKNTVLLHKEAIKVFIVLGTISARLPNQCRQLLDFERNFLDVYLETIGYELIALRERLKQLQGQLTNSRGGVEEHTHRTPYRSSTINQQSS